MDRKNRSDMCPSGSRTLDFLRARRAPYLLGRALRSKNVTGEVNPPYIVPPLSLTVFSVGAGKWYT